MMKAYFFTVRPPPLCDYDEHWSIMKKLHQEFGENIPLYLPLEGGPLSYLFCVSMDPHEILNICHKNNCEISGYSDDEEERYKEMFLRRAIYEQEIDSAKYNSEYITSICYIAKPMYDLEPISIHKGTNMLKRLLT